MLEDLCQVTLSINFAKSQESQTSDQCSSPHLLSKNAQRYKCFRCHGTSIQNCQECSNSGSITNSNPMVQLLQAVLTRKLMSRRGEAAQVEIIKEEEEEIEEKRILCSFCDLECQNSLYYCQECPWFHVCSRCEYRHLQHPHKVIQNSSSLCGQSFDLSIKLCYNCGNRIQDCYSLCKTCEKQGDNYWICSLCSDKNNFIHESNHLLEPMMDYQSYKDTRMETVSQQFEEEEQFNESIQIHSEKPEEDEEEEERMFHRGKMRLDKKNSSIAQYVIQNEDILILNHVQQKKQPASRVRFQIDEGLFGSCDFGSEPKIASKNILKPPTVKQQERFSCTISQSSRQSHYNDKENQVQESDYLFSGYKCDGCQCQPIKNFRFHCRQCQDYDVCSKCFDNIAKIHHHSQQDFEMIDGKLLHDRVVQKAMNCHETILQTSLTLTNRKSTRSKTLRLNSGYS